MNILLLKLYVHRVRRDEMSGDLDLKYGDHDEYEFHEPLMEYDKVQWDEDADGNKIYYAIATMRIKMSRKWMIHIWKIGFSSFFITLSSLICFAFDHLEHLDARISHVFTMLLTMVAFQFIVQQKLPAISYLTRMDEYMLFAMFFLFLVACFVSINGIFQVSEETDHGCAAGLLGFLFASNFVFIVLLYLDRKIEVKKLTMNTQELDAFEKGLSGKTENNRGDNGDDDEDEDDPDYMEVDKDRIHIHDMIKEQLDKDMWKDILDEIDKREKEKEKEKEQEKEKEKNKDKEEKKKEKKDKDSDNDSDQDKSNEQSKEKNENKDEDKKDNFAD